MRARAILGQMSYAAGCALAIVVAVAALHNLLLSVDDSVGPTLLAALAAIAAWLTGRAMRFMLLPPV